MNSQNNDRPMRSATWKKLVALAPCLLSCTPTNPHEIATSVKAPRGLSLVYCAATVAEADLMRQVLEEAGFHPEFVPSVTTGVFGTTGSAYVFVPKAETEEVESFLKQYFTSPPIDEDPETDSTK